MAYLAQRSIHAVASLEKVSIAGRFSNALVSYVRYLWKTLWPEDLAVFYPHPGTWPLPVRIGAGGVLFVFSALGVWRAKSSCWFGGGLWLFFGDIVAGVGWFQAVAQADEGTPVRLP